MSIGTTGIVGAFASQPLAQSHQTQQQSGAQSASEQARAAASANRASDAAGIGRTDADQQTGDRDADGRRLLERTIGKSKVGEESLESEAPRQSLDATGHSGTKLDLSG